MGVTEQFWQRLAEGTDLSEESFPRAPIVELAGTNRVLLENHCGIASYSRECVTVKVNYGCVHICGSGLEICRMSRERLVIRGRIEAVRLQRRE